ncbi:MAG: prolyl oligopeptidase family serine peptidase [Rubrivivax sp.]
MISRRDFSFALPLAAALPTMTLADNLPDDELLWLEDVQGERALAWVRERNAESEALLQKQPGFDATRERIRAILDSRDRIPGVVRRGPWLYNLWQDEHNPRGLWRRTTLAEYRKREPAWETVLDVDALGRAEGENWTWGGAVALGPEYRRVLVKLSRGGADAHVVREFDTVAKRFVDGGFVLPEAKSEVDWINADEIAVGTDFGPGSLTDSGYPRVVRRWRRGTPLAAATTMFEGQKTDVAAGVSIDHTPGYERTVFQRSVDFYRSEMFLLQGERLVRIDKPDDAGFGFWKSRVLITLRSDWTVAGRSWKSGSLLVADADAYLRGERRFEALFEPTATRSLAGMTATRDTLIVEILDNVAGRLEEWRPVDGRWQRREVAAPFPGTLSAVALHDPELANDPLADAYLLQYTDFLTPDTLALGHVGRDEREVLKSRPSFYDAGGMRVEQRFATSRDGTRVPYFVVWPRDAKADGANPTLLYGYGGFEVSMQPYYSGIVGSSWLARGGVFVLANIRGGGEFGPAWHQAAVGANRQKAYDDFAAVAEDLIATRVTSPRHLGIEGGSNGGLLVGAVMVQRPELFNAVVCQVPLLDMKRYTKLLAGASWMAEYGDPDDPAQWSFISRYSPFQNVRAGVKMPRVLFVTSTRDDRVHPGHARRMAERMRRQGHDVLYWENIEGGHGGAADNGQRAQMTALEYAFLQLQLQLGR